MLAIERGYFEVPWGVTLEEGGAEVGIIQQAASERVRRSPDNGLRPLLLGPSPKR